MPFVIDTHAHVFEQSLTMTNDKRYTPDRNALVTEYISELDKNGFTHGVLVQPSFLGTDNDYLLAALRAFPDRLRGVAVIDPGIVHTDLAELKRQGIAGIRLNMPGKPIPDFRIGPWPALQENLQQLELHVEVHCAARDLPRILPSFLDAGNIIVIDHFGRPDPVKGVADPGFQYLMKAGASGQVWVKLSAPYRLGSPNTTFPGTQIIQHLIDAIGVARLIWGSDWPHTLYTNRMDFGKAKKMFDEFVPDHVIRQRILGDSARQLFFGDITAATGQIS